MPDPHPLLQLLKLQLGAAASGTENDELLSWLLWAAQDAAEDGTGLTLTQAEATEIYTGDGSQSLVLKRAPLVSVAAVSVNGTAMALSTGYGADGYYIQDGILRIRGYDAFYSGASDIYATNILAGAGSGVIDSNTYNGNISVTYTAGYDYAKAPTIPMDLQRAILKMAAVAYQEGTHMGKRSQHTGPQETTTWERSWITPDVQTVLNGHARIVF